MKITTYLLFNFCFFLGFSQEIKIDTLYSDNVNIILDSSTKSLLETKENLCKAYNKRNIDIEKKNEILKLNREVDVCYERDKVDGIKIKVGSTKTIEEANKLKREVMKLFPNITTPEVKDVRPHYYVLIGDYFSRKAASKQFAEVRSKYPNAVLAPWRVYCRKAVAFGK